MTIDHLRQECMVPSPLAREREAHRQVLCPKTLSCPETQRERGREREKEIGKPFPFQNENQELSNCLF
jgi:hypothetical protein